MQTSRTRRVGSVLNQSYATRIMMGLIVSLVLMIAVANLPLYPSIQRVGWLAVAEPEAIILQEHREDEEGRASRAPVTMHTAPESVFPNDGEDEETAEEDQEVSSLPEPRPSYRADLKMAVLQFSQQMPKVIGGLSSYYINIEYPEEAKQAGIQGKLLLDFVVEPDGTPTDIQVLQSLHPLCDSAAVRALRITKFIPGRHNGQDVRVRMRLPVRFKLVDPDEVPEG